jgi:hypothetical protein
MGADKIWFSCAKKQRVEQIRTKARSETSELTTSLAKSSAKQQHATGGLSSLKWYEGIVWLFPRSFAMVRMRQSFRKMSSRQCMGLQPPSVKMCEKRRNHTIFLSFNEITWSFREWRGANQPYQPDSGRGLWNPNCLCHSCLSLGWQAPYWHQVDKAACPAAFLTIRTWPW